MKDPAHGVVKLDKLDISRAVVDKLCRDEKLEWENDLHVHKMKELGEGGGKAKK